MTEQNKVAELMKPRYKVIADWPGVAGKVRTGDIIVSDGVSNGFWVAGEPFTEGKLKDYPHLFKELHWWQGREISEMPEYLKLRGQNWVFKPIEYLLPYDVITPDEELETFKHQLHNFLPATKSEYDQYIKQKI